MTDKTIDLFVFFVQNFYKLLIESTKLLKIILSYINFSNYNEERASQKDIKLLLWTQRPFRSRPSRQHIQRS